MFVLTESFELSQKKLSVPQRGLRYKRCAVGRVTPRLKHDDSFLYTRVPNIAKQFSNTCVAIPHHPTPATEIPPPPAPLPLPKGRGWKSPADCSCDGCGTKKTPVRRGESSGAATLCNACGLRIKKNAVAASRDKQWWRVRWRSAEGEEEKTLRIPRWKVFQVTRADFLREGRSVRGSGLYALDWCTPRKESS